jgi:predicted nucleotidyltransferase
MDPLIIHRQMLEQVALALGEELLLTMTFVGGCTTGLLLTDAFSSEQGRHTDDVDLIVHVMGHVGFNQLQAQLTKHGFSISMPDPDENLPICAMKLGDLRVDFMPDDASVLGFTNRWYKAAMQTATPYKLTGDITINLVSPVYFIATKLEAYKGRGKGDALISRDIEDILLLVDGREELINEVQSSGAKVQTYIAIELTSLLQDNNFEYAVAAQGKGSSEREQMIFDRLELLAKTPVQQH